MPETRRPRILITRLSAIGDCILTTPVLNALRDCYPGAFLAWAVEKSSRPLLEGHPGLDQLVVLPRGWLKSPSAVWNLQRELRSFRFDTVVDPQSLSKSAMVAWLSGAPRRIGFAGRHGRELSKLLHTERVQPTATHLVDRSLELLRALNVQQPAARFDMPRYPEAEESVGEYLRTSRVGEFALVNVGAGWPSKLWPADRYGALARHLGEERSLKSLVVWSGDAERQAAEGCVRESAGQARLLPPTTLPELATFARHARLFVGSDTGPLHLASAVGVPCVGLYGPTQPQACGPYGPHSVAVQRSCPRPGSRPQRKGDNGAMRAIQVADALEACRQALGRERAHAVPSPASRDNAA